MVNNKFGEHYQVYLQEGDYMQVLKFARDYIHKGHTLLTHPLAGSVKPNETPYKSLMITTDKNRLNFESVKIIEESIYTCEKFATNTKFVTTVKKGQQEVFTDFQYIDCSLIKNAIVAAEMR